MKKYIAQIAVLGLVGAGLLMAPLATHAKDAKDNTSSASDQSSAPKPKHKTVPFHGKISAVDTSAMTLKVGNRTFQITSQTKILKDGNPATLSDAVVGESVRGVYEKTESGNLEAVTIHFGAKTMEKPKTPGADEQ